MQAKNNAHSLSPDAQSFLDAWKSTPIDIKPYPHYIIKNAFTPELILSTNKLPHKMYPLNYKVGSREEFNAYRQYLTPEIIKKNDCAKKVADVFLSPKIIDFIEKKGNITLKNTLLRIEHTIDTGNFWLAPHTDLGVKKFTMLIYLSEGEEMNTWGTDIYYNANLHCKTVSYAPNTALVFFPTNNTWHGFEPTSIKGVRRTFIINYVTKEWLNRQELVHPTKTVY